MVNPDDLDRRLVDVTCKAAREVREMLTGVVFGSDTEWREAFDFGFQLGAAVVLQVLAEALEHDEQRLAERLAETWERRYAAD
jgi:hypothetical protein